MVPNKEAIKMLKKNCIYIHIWILHPTKTGQENEHHCLVTLTATPPHFPTQAELQTFALPHVSNQHIVFKLSRCHDSKSPPTHEKSCGWHYQTLHSKKIVAQQQRRTRDQAQPLFQDNLACFYGNLTTNICTNDKLPCSKFIHIFICQHVICLLLEKGFSLKICARFG